MLGELCENGSTDRDAMRTESCGTKKHVSDGDPYPLKEGALLIAGLPDLLYFTGVPVFRVI